MRGIRSTSWLGRLSFHKVILPLHSSGSQDRPDGSEYIVLADGAHNPSSASTLGKFVASLVDHPQQVHTRSDKPRVITLSFILALSHSPPKTPVQTLTPLFSPLAALETPPHVQLRFRIALVRFSTPDGMSSWTIFNRSICRLPPTPMTMSPARFANSTVPKSTIPRERSSIMSHHLN